jgi:hypothetical protein
VESPDPAEALRAEISGLFGGLQLQCHFSSASCRLLAALE